MANVTAQVDRKTAYEGESITLSVRAENLAGMNKPDFSPLTKDFELSGTSQSSSISIINGRSTASQKWSVRLHPLKTGKIKIPALQVGQLKTLPIDIEIKPIPVQTGAPKKGQPLFITMDVDSDAEHFYVQQHIPLVVKLYYKHEIRQGRITDPQPDSASLEKLGDDTSYESQYNGQNYKVFERRYSLLVEKSGQLTIPAASFQGYMQKPQSYGAQQGYDPFSSFMLRSPVMNQGQPVSVRSEPLKLEIESHPPEFDGNQWLPAENLQLEDSWTSNPPTFRVGEPVSRTITIMAKGLVASQIKPLELPKVSSFRRYAEPAETETRTDGQTVYGVSRRTFTYIPAFAGEQKIPQLDIKWWNVVTGKQDVTSLPAWEIRVEANPAAQQGQPDSAVPDITDATQQATQSKDQNDK
ncbi:MAG: BatD family protein, partial [Gammaproteobacteria bacterium]|nr:BatD family protein [Gammaproteobacteria bacterium]